MTKNKDRTSTVTSSLTMMSMLLGFFSVVISSCMAKHGGFSAKLYRRDFRGSPSYDPTLSLTDRVSKVINRSFSHYNRSIATPSNSPKGKVKYHKLEYLMKIAVGTPPVELFLVFDTGSTLTWTQCQPCEHCFLQTAPFYDPRESSTYEKINRTSLSPPCMDNLDANDCVDDVCTYYYNYGDMSETSGYVSSDILTMESTTDQPVRQRNFIFGCGYNNKANISPEASGVIGMGPGPAWPFVAQMNHLIKGKFSYCLVPDLSGSEEINTINFGNNAVVRGPGVISTPLVFKDNTFLYYATLEALIIAGERFEFTKNHGNIIIDSGTTMNIYPKFFYTKVWRAFSRHTKGRSMPDPYGKFPLCYDYEGLMVPDTTANFAGGANISLEFHNLFFRYSSRIVCLAIDLWGGDDRNDAIWGNIAQTGHLIGFDLNEEILSFKPLDCGTIK